MTSAEVPLTPVKAVLPGGSQTPVIANETVAPDQHDASPKPEWSVGNALRSFNLPDQSMQPPRSPIQFFHLLERLKTTPREGWRRFNIHRGESIGDHMYRMSILTMMAPKQLASRLDIARCTRMALIHDMAESLVGDITPVDGISKDEKRRRESRTMDYISQTLLGNVEEGGRELGLDLKSVWQEYEDSVTLESKFVHDIDKLELVLQMVEYEKRHEGQLDLGEFAWVANRIMLPEVKAWCKEVLEERSQFWQTQNRQSVQGLEIGG